MNFSGVIIEESLIDKTVIADAIIISTRAELVTEKHNTPWVTQWTMHTVEIPAEDAASFAQKISRALDDTHSWYADFKNETEHYVIYPNRVFHITDRSDAHQYDEATQYGIAIGIPAYQVDFSPHVKQWER